MDQLWAALRAKVFGPAAKVFGFSSIQQVDSSKDFGATGKGGAFANAGQALFGAKPLHKPDEAAGQGGFGSPTKMVGGFGSMCDSLPAELLLMTFQHLDPKTLMMVVPAVSAWGERGRPWRRPKTLGQGVHVVCVGRLARQTFKEGA